MIKWTVQDVNKAIQNALKPQNPVNNVLQQLVNKAKILRGK